MNYDLAVFLMRDDCRAIGVTYENVEGEKWIHYKTLDPGINVNDYVLVPTDTRHKMTVCKVAAVDLDVDFKSSASMKWIIGIVNRADFDDLKRQEDAAIAAIKAGEKRKERDELRKTLEADAGEEMKSLAFFGGDDAESDGDGKPEDEGD